MRNSANAVQECFAPPKPLGHCAVGSAGDVAGFNMIAGTILVFGACGIRPGAAMSRGTLGFFGTRPPLLPTFRAAGRCRPVVMNLVLRQLEELKYRFDAAIKASEFELYHGDLIEGGRGEILMRA